MSDQGPTVTAVAALGGLGMLLWWLGHRGERGPGGGGSGTGGGARPAIPPEIATPRSVEPIDPPARIPSARPAAPISVTIRGGDAIELDGARSDLAGAVVAAARAGSATVRATGDARTGFIFAALRALVDAGARLSVPPDLLDALGKAIADAAAEENARRASAPI